MTTEALVPAAGEPAVATGGAGEIVLPRVIVDAGPQATARFGRCSRSCSTASLG